MQSLRITNYQATSLNVKPNDIPKDVWNNFICDYPKCGPEIQLPMDNTKRYVKTAAVLIAAIMDSLISWQEIDVLYEIREQMHSDNEQTKKVVADYNKFISQITPCFEKDQGSTHLKQQREYIYSHLNNQEGIELLFNVYRCILLSLYTQKTNSCLVRNGRKLSKQEAIFELLGNLNEDNQFILKDHHYIAISTILGLPIHCYINYSDGQQMIRKRIHQLANIRFTVALLFEPGHNNKSSRSVRILYQQHDSIYLNNLLTIEQNIKKKKNIMLAINKVQKVLESAVITTVQHCTKIVEQKIINELWPDELYQDLQILVQQLNFKTIKLDEILSTLDYNLQMQLDSFKIIVDNNKIIHKPNSEISPNRQKIFQSTYFRNQQAIINYQNQKIQKTNVVQIQQPSQIPLFESPIKQSQIIQPPKTYLQTTEDKQRSVSPSSLKQNISRSLEFHDKAFKLNKSQTNSILNTQLIQQQQQQQQ
ncbi:unnamed protein product [Paramecium pentaurelia]|uniref:Uncharacterized protein n=1 Tax=Paramecium pentaurelia TaxID=43138 RepID=A0A8S1XR13_9CILI|nr:unnamed protein product [Paramecium pentaurelia]